VSVLAPPAGATRALARSHVYRVAALAFRHPDADALPALRRLTAAPDLAGWLAPPVAAALAALHAALAATTADELLAEHVRTFGHVMLPDCALYETAAGSDGDGFRQSQALADLAGFYRAFGLTVAVDRVDHVAVELEFMHYLAYREAYALERHGPEAVAVLRDAQQRFLAEHLGAWGPALARTLRERSAGALRAAAVLLAELLAAEGDGGELAAPQGDRS
jgi:TorA maturation chaperone TorD